MFPVSIIYIEQPEFSQSDRGQHMTSSFMFTDIEGSTAKWQLHHSEMSAALALHDTIIRRHISLYSGREVKHTGDGFMIVFTNGMAIECALGIQRELQNTDWSAVDQLKVRIGIECGTATQRNGDYFGDAVNRAARVMSAGWGEQIVIGPGAAKSEQVPDGAELTDHGMHLLKDLLETMQLFTLVHKDVQSVFPPLTTVSARPNNLPVQPTEFVGRKKELAGIADLLCSPDRVVTLLGYGGAGKTRTSLQAAAEISSEFKHGIWFVPLENADGLNSIVSLISEALSIRFSGKQKPEDQLIDFLKNRETLLILDNFEHLVSHSAIVSKLVTASPALRVLVTSRQRLGIREEAVFDLSGMMLPETANEPCDSTDMFYSSVKRACREFAPEKEDRNAVVGICRILGGIPLAIELAAPWIRTISCTELEKELGSSLEILESSACDRPERQQSIDAVFQYSWDLLSIQEKSALAGFSIFEESFTREAAAEVTGCSLRTLGSLCDKSLVNSSQGKYSLHPLTKELAALHQSLLPALEEHYGSYFHTIATELHSKFIAENKPEILDQMAVLFPDIRKAVIQSFRASDPRMVITLIKPLSLFLQVRSQFARGVELYTALLQQVEDSKDQIPLRVFTEMSARLKERISAFLTLAGDREKATELLLEAANLSEAMADPSFRQLCLAGLGNMGYLKGDLDAAEEHWSEALAIARETGNTSAVIALLSNLAGIEKKRDNLPAAGTLLAEAAKLNSTTGDSFLQASIAAKLGDIAALEKNNETAEDFYTNALDLYKGLGNYRGSSYCLESLAKLKGNIDLQEGIALAEEAVDHAIRFDAVIRKTSSRLVLAELLVKDGRIDQAVKQLRAAQQEPGIESFPDSCRRIRKLLKTVGSSY